MLPIVLGALSLVAFAFDPAPALAAPCDAPVTNPVACENTKPGTPASDWQITGYGDEALQGYPTQMSVAPGDTVRFKIKSTSTAAYHIDILRLGYYGGDGARKMQGNIAPTGTSTQPACDSQASTGLVDCGNWAVSAQWTVPTTAVSGVYIAHLVRNSDPSVESHIVFVVRDDASDADIVVQTSDQTWQAYNQYGGSSLYTCAAVCPPGEPTTYKSAFKVSYNRPNWSEEHSPGSSLFNGSEYGLIRFLEANSYDVSYLSGVDTHARGSLLLNHKLFISSGHDEYWSRTQRTNVENARDAGVDLAFFSGNEMFWKTRFEPSMDGTAANRTLVSYKDTHFQQQQDPVSWTGTWRDGRFAPSADGVVPENALIGQLFVVNSGTSTITVPPAYRQLRLWRNTGAGLTTGQTMTLAPNTLGYEWDVDADNGFRPSGSIKLSSTTVSGVEVFTDLGSTTQFNGTATHNMTLYKASSGALVFGAGTVQWAWGLDNFGANGNADRNMQQATVNLFADMGVQPASLAAGLTAATKSTDSTAPTSSITSYPSTVADGTQVTISGTAADTGGGVVAGVEVSTDGGASWHPATGTTNWSYSWIAHGNPSTNVRVRATDDSANLQSPGGGVTVNVTCPCSIWGPNTNVPADNRDSGDPTATEVGVKFKSDKFGTVSGLRFYKSAANTGTHVGTVWSESGQELARATFQSESASGWQSVTFSSPVQIQPNTTYVASYHAPAGRFSASLDYFQRGSAPGPAGGAVLDSPPLHAARNTGSSMTSTTNGVYSYSPTPTFPTNSFGAANYWVDVIFTPTPVPGTVSGVTATSGGKTSANVSWSSPATGGTVTQYRVTPYVGSSPQSSTTVDAPATTTTITGLTTGTTYTFRVAALNPNGTGPESAPSGAVTPLTAVAPSVPRSVSAVAASQQARVTWTAPQADGDAAITGYTITPYAGSTALSAVSAGATATSATVSGLTNGTSYTFRVTATNSAGTSPPGASSAVVPQATLFDLQTPDNVDAGDGSSIELGAKFKADHNGWITGIRFYKSAANTGTHIGTLWSAAGSPLASATFTNESPSGWQSVTFASPVAVTAGTTYVASYFAPRGHYAAANRGLTSAIDNAPLHTIASTTSANGVYAYSAGSTFPTSSWESTNYWVDVMYAIPAPGQVTGVSAEASGKSSATVTWSAPSSGGPVAAYEVTPYAGGVAQSSTTITGNPPDTERKLGGLTTGTTYTFTVKALNANGSGPASAQSNSVTPLTAVVPSAPSNVRARPASQSALVSWTPPASDGDSPITRYTITPFIGSTPQAAVDVGGSTVSTTITGLQTGSDYTFRVSATNGMGTSRSSAPSNTATPAYTVLDFGTPSTPDAGEPDGVTLGMKFRSDFPGTATGVRFYKSAANTGTHVGTLWSATGQELARVSFSDETATGWQHATFSAPVALVKDATYVIAYHAPNGRYSAMSGGFSNAIDNPPLHGLANSTSSNGVYTYGSSTVFPTSTWGAANYAVDVLFQPAPAPGAPTGVTATAGAGSARVSWTAPTSGGPVTSYTVTPYIGSAAQSPTTVTGSPPATNRSITGLTAGTSYTFRVKAANISGSSAESSPSSPVTVTGATAPGAPTGVTAEADSTAAIVRWTEPSDDGGAAITGYRVTPYVGTTAQSATTVGASSTRTTITGLTNGTNYTFRVAAINPSGTGANSGASNGVAPKASIFELATPTTIDSGDAGPVVLGLKFTSDVSGSVTGLRFYKAAANTGTHVGSLWPLGGGSPLATGSFVGESASGWQTLTFSAPVAITAGTTYVASYLSPNGRYSVTGAAFGNPFDSPPLRALSNSESANGVYAYSASSVYPTGSWNASNYWVDVLFDPGA